MNALTLLLLTLAGAQPSVHTELQATYPATDSFHRAEIREIRLRFSTAVQLPLSTVTLFGPAGVVRVPDTLRHVAGSDERELRLPLPGALGSGTYRVEWRTAGPDGHALRGEFGFEVEHEPAPATPPESGARTEVTGAPQQGAPPDEAVPDEAAPPQVALTEAGDTGRPTGEGRSAGAFARWLLYLAMAAGLGGALFRTVVLARLGSDQEARDLSHAVTARMSTIAWVGVAAGLVALPLALGVQSVQTFGEGGLAPTRIARVLGSAWGGAFMLQVAGVALLALGLLVVRARSLRWGWLLAGAAGVLLAVGSARAGHAAESGTLAVVVQSLHGAAAATWLGALVLLVLAVLPSSRKTPAVLPRVVDAFSPLALTAVLVLVASGALNSWDRLDGPASLVSTTFGRVLALKLALFGIVAALGFYNWRTVRPALRREPSPGLLRVPASVEMTVGVIVLAVTAVLVALPLP
jgi:putative copper export protein/methionine-rich copper-binding protein CopC